MQRMLVLCWDCSQLSQTPTDVPPHQQLRFNGWVDDPRRQIRAYACEACGTKWTRDYDGDGPRAGWWVERRKAYRVRQGQ